LRTPEKYESLSLKTYEMIRYCVRHFQSGAAAANSSRCWVAIGNLLRQQPRARASGGVQFAQLRHGLLHHPPVAPHRPHQPPIAVLLAVLAPNRVSQIANVYLYYVFDLWAQRWRRRAATGDMIIVRYADGIVVGFEHEHDARRFLDMMRTRLEEFSLTLHPEKTRLIEFGRYAASNRKRRGLGKPETFTFPGFVFICGVTRQGQFQLKRKTRRDRMRMRLKEIKDELRWRMHQPIPKQGRWLRQVVAGFFNYHAVPTNSRALGAFRCHVTKLWRRSLKRRSQKAAMTWARMGKLANDWLPEPRILHPWPSQRFAVKHPRWEPYAGIPLVRICAGDGQ